MTLKDVIAGVDEIQPNPYSNAAKTAWLNELAAQIQTEVWLINGQEAVQYEYGRDENAELLPVPAAYGSMWSSWLRAKIHLANAENDLYANMAEIFNSVYGAYIRFFARTYEPSNPRRKRTLRCGIAANGDELGILRLPPKALAVNVRLNVAEPCADSVVQLWAGPAKTPIGPETDVSTPGIRELGCIDCAQLGGELDTVVGMTTYDAQTKMVLSMTVFVPREVYVTQRRLLARKSEPYIVPVYPSPTPAQTYSAGDGIEIEESVIAMQRNFYEYLNDETYQSPTIAHFAAPELIGTAVIGAASAVSYFIHGEANAENIAGSLTLSYAGQIISAEIAPDASQARVNIGPVTVTKNSSGSMTFTLSGEDTRGRPFSRNLSKSFYNPIFWGAAVDQQPTDTFLNSLTSALSDAKGRTVTITAGAGEYLWYAVPARLGACSFKVGGFDGGFGQPVLFTYTNSAGFAEDYAVYRSDNAGLGTTTVIIT